MTPESFYHVAIKTDSIEESLAFYRDRFDATVVDRGDPEGQTGATAVTHVALEIGDKLLYLFDRAPYEAAGHVESVPTGFLHFGYVVPDADDAFESVVEGGAGAVMEPATFGDLRIAFVTDPSGVRIELLEHR